MSEQRTVPTRLVESLEDVQVALDELIAAHNNLASMVFWGTGTPEGSVTAPVGCEYRRRDGGAATSLYVKESGSGNTGWVGK